MDYFLSFRESLQKNLLIEENEKFSLLQRLDNLILFTDVGGEKDVASCLRKMKSLLEGGTSVWESFVTAFYSSPVEKEDMSFFNGCKYYSYDRIKSYIGNCLAEGEDYVYAVNSIGNTVKGYGEIERIRYDLDNKSSESIGKFWEMCDSQGYDWFEAFVKSFR